MDKCTCNGGVKRVVSYLDVLSKAQKFRGNLERDRQEIEVNISDLTSVVIESISQEDAGSAVPILVNHLRNLHTLYGLLHKSHKLLFTDPSVERTVAELKKCYKGKDCNHPYRFEDNSCAVCGQGLNI